MPVSGIGTNTVALEQVLALQGCSGAGLEGLWGQERQLQPSLQRGVSWVHVGHAGQEEAAALWRRRPGSRPAREVGGELGREAGREQTSGKETAIEAKHSTKKHQNKMGEEGVRAWF